MFLTIRYHDQAVYWLECLTGCLGLSLKVTMYSMFINHKDPGAQDSHRLHHGRSNIVHWRLPVLRPRDRSHGRPITIP